MGCVVLLYPTGMLSTWAQRNWTRVMCLRTDLHIDRNFAKTGAVLHVYGNVCLSPVGDPLPFLNTYMVALLNPAPQRTPVSCSYDVTPLRKRLYFFSGCPFWLPAYRLRPAPFLMRRYDVPKHFLVLGRIFLVASRTHGRLLIRI